MRGKPRTADCTIVVVFTGGDKEVVCGSVGSRKQEGGCEGGDGK